MPTEKQVRKALHRVWFHWYRLQDALNDAYLQDVIVYPPEEQHLICNSHGQTRDLFERYSKDALADAVQTAVRLEARR